MKQKVCYSLSVQMVGEIKPFTSVYFRSALFARRMFKNFLLSHDETRFIVSLSRLPYSEYDFVEDLINF